MDGVNRHFFKATWPVVQANVYAAIMDFFNTDKVIKSMSLLVLLCLRFLFLP